MTSYPDGTPAAGHGSQPDQPQGEAMSDESYRPAGHLAAPDPSARVVGPPAPVSSSVGSPISYEPPFDVSTQQAPTVPPTSPPSAWYPGYESMPAEGAYPGRIGVGESTPSHLAQDSAPQRTGAGKRARDCALALRESATKRFISAHYLTSTAHLRTK